MPPKKRSLAEVEVTLQPKLSNRRQSTRLSSTGKKSSYFEHQSEEDGVDESGGDGPPPRKATKTAGTSSSSRLSRPRSRMNVSDDDDEDQYEDDDGDDDTDVPEEEADDDDDDDDDGFESEEKTPTPKKSGGAAAAKRGRGRPPSKSGSTPGKGRGRPVSTSKAGQNGGSKVTRKGADEDDDEDEDEDDGPQVTFIPLPKLRDTNGVEYEDTRIHPNTLHFLGDLRANNQRNWLKMHDPEFRRSLKDWESFVKTLTDKIIEADETVPELPLKDVIFRIYRDIRFSKDPTPYKPHYSAAWSRTGRKGPYACYYVHIEPGKCLVGGGLWHPEASALANLRASIDERPHRIRRVLIDPEFVRVFLPRSAADGKNKKKNVKSGKKTKGKGDDEEGVGEKDEENRILRAFADHNKENALKTKPKGFNPDHRDINLLKLRNFTIGRQLADEEMQGDDAQEKIMELIRAMVPFITYLNDTVMPDLGVDSDSEGEEGEAANNEQGSDDNASSAEEDDDEDDDEE